MIKNINLLNEIYIKNVSVGNFFILTLQYDFTFLFVIGVIASLYKLEAN